MAYPQQKSQSVQGQTLDINVVGGSNLSNKEWFSRQDPYVVLEYSGQKFRTRTDTDGGRNPSFNETFKITMIEGLREVNASVWNSNTIERDDYIGSTKILLNKVIDCGYDDSPWQLTNTSTGKTAGVLKLILHYAASKTKPSKQEANPYGVAPPPACHPAPAYGHAPSHSHSHHYPPQPYPQQAYCAPPPPVVAPPAFVPVYAAPPQPIAYPPQPVAYVTPAQPAYHAAPAYHGAPAYPQAPPMPYPQAPYNHNQWGRGL